MGSPVYAGDMKMFVIVCVSDFISLKLVCGVNCDACEAHLTSWDILLFSDHSSALGT